MFFGASAYGVVSGFNASFHSHVFDSNLAWMKTRKGIQIFFNPGFVFFTELDYVYAQCCGIFIASTVYFALYCAAMNNRPRIYSRAIMPGNVYFTDWSFLGLGRLY